MNYSDSYWQKIRQILFIFQYLLPRETQHHHSWKCSSEASCALVHSPLIILGFFFPLFIVLKLDHQVWAALFATYSNANNTFETAYYTEKFQPEDRTKKLAMILTALILWEILTEQFN